MKTPDQLVPDDLVRYTAAVARAAIARAEAAKATAHADLMDEAADRAAWAAEDAADEQLRAEEELWRVRVELGVR